jgi:exocyst complex component 2
MADNATLLNHYKIDTLDPGEWPAEKDLEDSSDDEGLMPPPQNRRKLSRSRYSVLEGSVKRTSVPGAERTKDGIDNLVQKDEADPLGGSASVIQTLKREGMRIGDGDSRLRMNEAYRYRKLPG